MSKIHIMRNNTLYNFMGKLISLLINFFYVVLIARYLGPSNYGILAIALSLTGMFGFLINFGIDPLFVREVSRNKSIEKAYLYSGVILKLFFGTMTFLIIMLISYILQYSSIVKEVVCIISFSAILTGINMLFWDVYQVEERMIFTSIGIILRSVFTLFGVYLAISLKFDVVGISIVYLVSNIFLLFFNIIIYVVIFDKDILPTLKYYKKIVKEAWPFAASGIFVSIYFWIDSIMLSYMKGSEAVGIYNVAYRLVYILLMLPSAYFMAIYPHLSQLFLKSQNRLKFIYERSLKYFTILGVFIGLFVMFFSREIILTIYGVSYLPSSIALKILIWAVAFSFMANATMYTINSIDKQIIYTKVTAVCAIINVFLNLLFIPLWGYVGASFITVLTEALGFILMFIYLYKYFKESFSEFKWFLRLLITIGVSVMGYYGIYILSKNKTFSIFIFSLVFGLCVVLFKALDKKDIYIFKKALHLEVRK